MIVLGHSQALDTKGLLQHTLEVDKQLTDIYNVDGYNSVFKSKLATRGFTYTEYLELFDN